MEGCDQAVEASWEVEELARAVVGREKKPRECRHPELSTQNTVDVLEKMEMLPQPGRGPEAGVQAEAEG